MTKVGARVRENDDMTWTGTVGGQRFFVGSRVLEDHLNSVVAELESASVVLLHSASGARSGAAGAVATLLGGGVLATYTDIAAHAPIARSAEIARDIMGFGERPGAIVALGGGSVSDTAKAVAVLLAEGGDLEDHCSTFRPPDFLDSPVLAQPKIPVIAIPMTFSAAEVTPGAGATNAEHVKRVFWDPKVAARAVFYDIEVLRAVPRDVQAPTVMNALAHCVEGLYSRTRSPLTDPYAEEGIRRLVAGIEADTWAEGLAELATGAVLSGLVISQARVGLHHAICHVLGSVAGISHGAANSAMLPSVLRFNLPAVPQASARIADALALGADKDVPAAVARLRGRLEAPARLRDLGVQEKDFAQLAELTMQDRGLYFNPRRVDDASTVVGILADAW